MTAPAIKLPKPPEERMDPRTEQVIVELRALLSMMWHIVRGEGPAHEVR